MRNEISRRRLAILTCLPAVLLSFAAIGCASAKNDFDYDKNGWGGDNLKYAVSGDTIQLGSGMMVNRDFRWAGGEISFEFQDTPDLVWGIKLLDLRFRPERRARICSDKQLVRDQKGAAPYVGTKFPKSDYWKLWRFDSVFDFKFYADAKVAPYKALGAVWNSSLQEDHVTACVGSNSLPVDIQRNEWNTLRVQIANGECRYWINGVPNPVGQIKIDPRYDGQLAVFVEGGGPLCIRNLRLTSGKKP